MVTDQNVARMTFDGELLADPLFIALSAHRPPDRPRSAYQVREVYEEYVPEQIPSLKDPIRDLYKSL